MQPVTVSSLELKIPPVLVTVFFGLSMWLVTLLLPPTMLSGPYRLAASIVLLAAGAFFSLSGVLSFKRAGTTVNPITPGASAVLVTSGIYKKTRNPMYVGFLFFLLAWGLFLSNGFALLLSLFSILYMNRFQVRPEEKVLALLFGEAFLAYQNSVRRWL